VSQQTTNRSFDELAKGLATGTLSRGKALRWMGGALLGAALASFPGVAWANDCRRLGRECRRDSQCCSRNCIRRGDDKVCGCPEGQSRCADRCVNLKTNERHCGSCSERCGTNQTCCNGNCVNLQRNERHCGACGNRCPEGSECVGGECQGGGCPPERTLTEGDCHCAFVCGDQFPSPATCQDDPNCLCSETTEGTGFCARHGGGGCPPECSSSSDCEPGSACVVNTCCDHPICLPPCTPTCAQNGSTCSANDQCCSGRCAGSMCAEPCPSGTVLLCNGTCAKPCTSETDCTGCNFVCTPELGSDPPRSLCSNITDGGDLCETSCDCPSGRFCRGSATENFCVFAC
jgi:Stigma-specific protein, Stig1